MTYIASARGGTTAGSSTTMTLTVPAGVTTAHTSLLCLAGSNPTMPASFTVSGGGATVTTVLAPVVVNNMWFALYRVKNVAAGAVLTIVGTTANVYSGALHCFTTEVTVGSVGTRNGVTQAFVNVPTLAALDGLRSWIVASDRTAAATAISSATNSNGSVTQKYYDDPNVTNEGQVSFYLGEFISTSTATGQSVVTWNGSSGNAVGLHVVEVTPVPAKVWSGSAWVRKPVKVWVGTGWRLKPVKVWTGAAWKVLT